MSAELAGAWVASVAAAWLLGLWVGRYTRPPYCVPRWWSWHGWLKTRSPPAPRFKHGQQRGDPTEEVER